MSTPRAAIKVWLLGVWQCGDRTKLAQLERNAKNHNKDKAATLACLDGTVGRSTGVMKTYWITAGESCAGQYIDPPTHGQVRSGAGRNRRPMHEECTGRTGTGDLLRVASTRLVSRAPDNR